MLKKLWPFVLLLVIAIPVGVLLLSHKDKVVSTYQSQALSVVPDDAVWIVESRSVPELVKALTQSDPLFPSLEQSAAMLPHLAALRKIDSLISHNPRFKELYAHRPAVISLHQTGKNMYQFLVILEMQGTPGAAGAGELFSELSGSRGQWSQRVYNGQQMNRITFGVDALIPGISMAENSKYLVISPSPILLENAVRQMNQETGLYNTPAFRKLSHTAGQGALANIYVNLKAVPVWMSGWMNPPVKKKMEVFTRYGDWASLDQTIRNDAIWMNGFALEGDTLNSYLGLFRNQPARKLQAEQYLPSNTAAYFTFGIEKQGQFLKSLSDYLGGGESGRRRQRLIEKANAKGREDVVKTWADLGFRELTIGYLCGVADETIRTVALIDVKNGNQARDKLLSQIGKTPKKVFKVDDQHDFNLYGMPYEGLPEMLGGGFFTAIPGKFFAVTGNTLVLTEDIQTLEEVLYKYSLNKTLANDAVYRSLAGLFTTRSNVTFFAVPYRAWPILKGILNPKTLGAFFANDRFLMKTGAVGLQFQSSNDMMLHNLFVSFANIDYTKPQTIWESRLDAKVLTAPAIVTNHITHDKEIMVQDEALNLYLISSSGRILWKKNIGEKIKSEIFQIDVLKNGRLQYLFSTVSGIHLLDRNGAYLPKFPLKLKLPATNGMALIDFDATRDYRILIACSDNKVYSFDKNGNQLKGWNFGPASGIISLPVQYFKIQNKDYLLVADPVKVYILDRKGAVKVKPEKDFAVSMNSPVNFETVASGKGSRFILTDVDGAVHSIFLDGTVESKSLGTFSADHFFNVVDINRDGLSEFVFTDRNRFEIYSQAGEKLHSRKLDGNVVAPPVFPVLISKNRKAGITIPSKNQILLLNGDGTVYEGFPLNGQTPFTIGILEKNSNYQNLLVGGGEAYLYNYAIK